MMWSPWSPYESPSEKETTSEQNLEIAQRALNKYWSSLLDNGDWPSVAELTKRGAKISNIFAYTPDGDQIPSGGVRVWNGREWEVHDSYALFWYDRIYGTVINGVTYIEVQISEMG